MYGGNVLLEKSYKYMFSKHTIVVVLARDSILDVGIECTWCHVYTQQYFNAFCCSFLGMKVHGESLSHKRHEDHSHNCLMLDIFGRGLFTEENIII